MKKNNFDPVLSNYQLADGTAMDIIELSDSTPVIIITGECDEKTIVKELKKGAVDYLIKDVESKYLNILPLTIESAIN